MASTSSRKGKPSATAANLKDILSRPTRKLTKQERAERTAFEGFEGKDAVAVEPSGNFSRLG